MNGLQREFDEASSTYVREAGTGPSEAAVAVATSVTTNASTETPLEESHRPSSMAEGASRPHEENHYDLEQKAHPTTGLGSEAAMSETGAAQGPEASLGDPGIPDMAMDQEGLDPNTSEGEGEDEAAGAMDNDEGNFDSSETDPRTGNQDWQPPKKRRRKPEPIKPFNDMLYDLLAFRAREGHCRVPLDSKSALGRWVANLRTQKSNLKKGYHSLDLSPERLAVLESVGFVWDLQQFDSDARWKRQFDELLAFKTEHGHCNVPQSTPLGKWVKMQRENYRETQLKTSGRLPSGRSKPRPTLSHYRIKQLESLGFNWKVAAPAVGWEHRYQELLEYRRIHGDCNVPQAWQENRQLGRWVMKQRCQYTLRQKGEKNQLSDERVARLEEIGFSWTAPSFRKKKEGHARELQAANAGPALPQIGQHLLPPGAGQALPPHDFRRWCV